MKQTRIAMIFGLVLAAAPALASTDPGHAPGSDRKAVVPATEQLFVEKQEPELPLECRGYYVRNFHRKPGGLSRCE
jgi:hypothetical protein